MGYKKALLEFATLASSKMILGTTGSTFAREAAYFGGVHIIMRNHRTYKVKYNMKNWGKCNYVPSYGENVFNLTP